MRHILLLTLSITAVAPSPVPFKNLQVFQGLSDAELYGAMNFMAGSLGVTCEHCHVNPWDADTREAKVTARRMIRMVRSINETSFGGRQVVTCASCHQGQQRPPTTPDLANAAWARPRETPSAAPVSVDPGEVIARYVVATGATVNQERGLSRHLVGVYEVADGMRPQRTVAVDVLIGPAGELRMDEKWPNRPTLTVWNGREGWITTGARTEPMAQSDIDDAGRTIEMFRVFEATALDGLAPSAAAHDPRTVLLAGKDARGRTQLLSFVIKTGLLDRRDTIIRTPLGPIVERVDYADYRRVGGFRVPFTITASTSGQQMRPVPEDREPGAHRAGRLRRPVARMYGRRRGWP